MTSAASSLFIIPVASEVNVIHASNALFSCSEIEGAELYQSAVSGDDLCRGQSTLNVQTCDIIRFASYNTVRLVQSGSLLYSIGGRGFFFSLYTSFPNYESQGDRVDFTVSETYTLIRTYRTFTKKKGMKLNIEGNFPKERNCYFRYGL